MKALISSKIKLVAVLLSFVVILTACGGVTNSVNYENPNKAIDAYVKGQNIVGLTVEVKATLSDTGSEDIACSFYSEGYNGSFKENVLVSGYGAIQIKKDKVYTVKITEVRKSNNTYVIIGDFQ